MSDEVAKALFAHCITEVCDNGIVYCRCSRYHPFQGAWAHAVHQADALGLTPEWAVQNNGPENPPYHSHKTIAGAENHKQTILGNYPGASRNPQRRELDDPVVVSRLISPWTEATP